MKRFLIALALAASFFGTKTALDPTEVASQIGYGSGGTTITGYTDGGVPAAGAGGDIWQFDATVNAADGSDIIQGIVVDITNADHTGSSNEVNGITVATLATPDAQAVESGVYVGSGWDFNIQVDDPDAKIEGGGSSTGLFSLTIGGLQAIRMAGNTLAGTAAVHLGQGISSAVGGSDIFVLVDGAIGIMNGSDQLDMLKIDDFTDVNHTTGSNIINGLNIGSITSPDAEAIHHAITIGTAWETGINFLDTAPEIRFANNGTLHFEEAGGGATVFAVQDAEAVADGVVHTRAATTNQGSHFSAGRGSSFAAQDGSDLAAFFRVDAFTDAAHSSTGNDILALHAETVTTPDADSTRSIVGGEGGWDFFVWNNAALGTDAWTTALDKTALTAAGTLRVEINGTVYHIQLYADS